MGLAGRVRDDDLDDLVLALNEAATNAVLHGSGGGHPVEVVVHVSDGWAEMTVLDRGPVQRPPRGWYDDEAEAESAPVTGRGLWLMGRLVDEVRIERIHPQGTRVTLRRRVGARVASGRTGNGTAGDPRTA
jgi:anti-sigma regulatory factor (Ser/Thr protein kinase)